MRIFIASDLHLGNNIRGDQSAKKLAGFVCDQGASEDILILLGDLAEDDSNARKCLLLFADFPGQKLAIAGNHDIWVKDGEKRNSMACYNSYQEMLLENNFVPLENQPVAINGIQFIGSMGWYDYSFKDSIGIPTEAYQAKTYSGRTWGDARFVRWEMNDAQATVWQIQKLRKQIEESMAGLPIIVCMHHVPTKKLLFHPRWLVPKHLRFFNAFLGSSQFEKLFSEFANLVQYVFCGHIHLTGHAVVDGINYYSVGGNYFSKELIVLNKGRLKRITF